MAENRRCRPDAVIANIGDHTIDPSQQYVPCRAASNGASLEHRTIALVRGYSVEILAKGVHDLDHGGELLPLGTAVSTPFIASDRFGERVRAAESIRARGLEPVPHICARRLPSLACLDKFLADLTAHAGVERVLVIGGDVSTPHCPFNDTSAVVESGLLAKYGIRKVGVGGYPDGHPHVSARGLARSLQDKVRLLAEHGHECYVTTQFSFNACGVFEWLASLRECGMAVPVRVGVPGPASARALLQFASRCGVAASTDVLSKYGLSLGRLLSTSAPDAFVSELADGLDPALHGQVALHFYPFGGLRKTSEWINSLDRNANR